MPFVRVLPCLMVAALLGGCRAQEPEPSTPPAPPPAAGTSTIVLSPTLPADVTVDGNQPIDLPTLQKDFDVFSWNSFIAVSWPPGPDGTGDPDQKPGAGPTGDNPTVWETYKDVSTVFLPGGQKPVWDAPPAIPAVCRTAFQPGMKVLAQIGKTPGLLDETTEPFDTGPLVDLNRAFTRFEIVVNREMFDYIVANQLYSQAGQQAFKGTVQFPCGGAAGAGVGAVMIKAAWKVLGEGDDPSRFHTSKALVYTPATANPPVQESCVAQTVGLVGLHIGHKTESAPQWIWSTFEQVDNVPTEAEVQGGTLKAHYNYFDPACKDCAVNQAPPRPWIPNLKTTPPSQVVRVDTLPDFARNSAQQQNQTALGLLQGVNQKSVWQFYQLISTQWPTDPGSNCVASPTAPLGNPAPQFLANTTLETYIQGQTPNVSSSCIGCHGNAAMTTGAASDFTYVLQRAQ